MPGPGVDGLRYRDNVLAAERVLRAVPPSVPVVVASSSSVYGGALHGGRLHPSRESDPLRPCGGYARSKVELERRCWQRAAAGGLVAVARPFTVAGERQRPDMAIARRLAAVRGGQPIRILGDPNRTRDVTDVGDVAFGLLGMAARAVTGPVNLGTGVGHRLAEIASAVGAALGEQAEVVTERPDPRSRQPRWPIPDAAAGCSGWCRGLTWRARPPSGGRGSGGWQPSRSSRVARPRLSVCLASTAVLEPMTALDCRGS
jgi:nucleoside-diphosphate-sugar epimerase